MTARRQRQTNAGKTALSPFCPKTATLYRVKMPHKQDFNQARLPRYLSRVLTKLHIAKLTFGLILLALGVTSIIVYQTNLYVIILGACISSVITGTIGLIANNQRSLVLHAGCSLTAAISFYLSLLAYAACTAAASALQVNAWLVIISALVLVMDIMSATFNVGVELCVMYVAVSMERVARENLQETEEPC